MGKRGRAPTRGRCPCGHRYHPTHREWGLPAPVARALDRANAVRLVGTTATHTGVGIQQAITENA